MLLRPKPYQPASKGLLLPRAVRGRPRLRRVRKARAMQGRGASGCWTPSPAPASGLCVDTVYDTKYDQSGQTLARHAPQSSRRLVDCRCAKSLWSTGLDLPAAFRRWVALEGCHSGIGGNPHNSGTAANQGGLCLYVDGFCRGKRRWRD